MTHKHIELMFGLAIWVVLFVSLLLLVVGLFLGGLAGLWMALPIVGMLLGLSILVLGFVPLAAALLLTLGAKLVRSQAGPWRELLSDYWVTCVGCTLIVVGYGGGLVCLYDWLVRPVLH